MFYTEYDENGMTDITDLPATPATPGLNMMDIMLEAEGPDIVPGPEDPDYDQD